MSALRLLHRYQSALAHFAVILLIALPLFGHLDEAPIQVWDEMRNAQNALEMNNTGQLIVTTIDYRPETWNTKPPLMIWILAVSQRIFGYNEMAVRLPSAIAAALTCLLLLRFAKRRTDNWLPGIIAVLILVTTKGYVAMHGTRTGDYDSMLTLFTTASLLWLVNYVEDGGSRRWLFAATAALTAAVLTKGIAGLFVCPAMLGYVLFRRKAPLVFQRKVFYGCAAAFIIIIGGYYALREVQQPGYLDDVMRNELGGRFNSAVETHGGDFWTYYNELINTAFVPWIWWLIPSALGGIFAKDIRYRRLALLCGLAIISILLILSSGSTKLGWYMMPVYPFLALFCGLGLYQVMEMLRQWPMPAKIWRVNFLPFLLLLLVGVAPYSAMLEETLRGKYPKAAPGMHDTSVYLKEVIAGDRSLNGSVLCGDTYPLYWYKQVVHKLGKQLYDVEKDSLRNGMNVFVWEDDTRDFIRRHYKYIEVETFRSLTIYRIEGGIQHASTE